MAYWPLGEMRLRSAVDQEIRDLIHKHGRITFAQFMQACLYSPHGGFYSSRGTRISTHFGTSPTSHPVFGALIARQLEQMWHLLGDPPVFHVLEVGSGDGALAQAIVHACGRMAPRLAQVLYYVAADYEPRWLPSPDHPFAWDNGTGDGMSPATVSAEGFRAAISTSARHQLNGAPFPATVSAEGRQLNGAPSLTEGYRGEVNLAMEDWTGQLSRALDRGFILTIDYGQLATDLYSLQNNQGTLVCYHRHVVSSDPYQHIGHQDMTCQVDFTSLMRLGDRHGLATVGYALQRQFLTNLGFASCLDALPTQGLSAARTALSRMAMMTLIDPDEYGDFKVLAQAKGHEVGMELLGFARQGT